jgi:hypothetical protein
MTLTPRAREGREENRRGEDDHFVQASHVVRCDSWVKARRKTRYFIARAAPEERVRSAQWSKRY